MPLERRSSRKPSDRVIEETVAVVIVNYRTPELTAKCLAALRPERSSFRRLRAMVVDGGSSDDSADELSALIRKSNFADWVTFLPLPINGGFGWANNQAIQRLMRSAERPRYIHLLNPDAEIEEGAVRLLAEYLSNHPGAAAVGSQLLEPDGSLAGSAFSFPSIRGEFSRGARTAALDRILRLGQISIDASGCTEVDWVTGASVMFRVEALREVGLFDEGFFLYHEEIELMWRLRKAGWSVAIEPRSRVRHVGGSATGVHGRESTGPADERKPSYVYRSRSRYFGLTRGRGVAILAFAAWVAGYAVWRVRHALGVGSGKPLGDRFSDHVRTGFPRDHDFVSAATPLDGSPTTIPAWMDKQWL